MDCRAAEISHWVAFGHITKGEIYDFAGVECMNTLKGWLNKPGNFESLQNHVGNIYARAQRDDKRTGG